MALGGANDILEQAHNISFQLRSAQEQYLLEYFGSIERAREVAHLYIFEEHPTEYKTDEDGRLTVITYKRLRLKTPEELAADQQ